MKVELNKIYYFNNRPVVVLREENEEFVFVAADLKLDHNITGSNFCIPCNTDGYYHTCEQAGEVIDAIMENIEDSDCFWVAKRYLKERPFEYKECTALRDKIQEFKTEKQRLLQEISELEVKRQEALSKAKESEEYLLSLRNEVESTQEILAQQLEEIEEINKGYKPEVHVSKTSVKISADTLLNLLQSDIELNYLQRGGVDNWEWYGECFPDDYDIEAEAFEIFKSL